MNDLNILPVLPLRGLTAFPNMLIHFDVGRMVSIKALEIAMKDNQAIFLTTQEDVRVDLPSGEELYVVGTLAKIRQIMKLPSDTVRVLVEGVSRGCMHNVVEEGGYISAEIEPLETIKPKITKKREEAILRVAKEKFDDYLITNEKTSADIIMNAVTADDIGILADHIAQHIAVKYTLKQAVLEELNEVKRMEMVIDILNEEVDVLKIEDDIQAKLRRKIDKNQREYYLREQLKVIRSELGEDNEAEESAIYAQKILKLKLGAEAEEKLMKEVERLNKMSSSSQETAVIRTYLDACLDLPWNKKTADKINLTATEKVLNADHYGLEKVKERILEFMAVRKLAPDLRGQIICLSGPPGVGKTSVAASIAKAMGRKFARVSLGGVRDEAEIRGHRKTYVGAMPGRMINALRQAKSANPVILLDEIDKMSGDFRGDPASALLEVLDKEQNNSFRDHYIEIPFDLSDVLFITTANDISQVPRPLKDRMEIIELGTYTNEEKLQIAKRHLFPKQVKQHGLKKTQLLVSDEMLRYLINGYTRESGVRRLEQLLAKLCRKCAKQIVSGVEKKIILSLENIEDYLGPAHYKDELKTRDEIGVVNGLAFTSVGGEILEVEVNVLEGTGKIEVTGNLGTVMQESAKAAISFVRSRAKQLEINPLFYKENDIHIHFPEAATPKDGPSAGVTIATAMISALTGIPVRHDVAMTGEISIRGRVLPIGGLKEKTMAAYRNQIKTVIIPKQNESDLKEIDPVVYANMKFVLAETLDDVIAVALNYSAEKLANPSYHTDMLTQTVSNIQM